MLSTATRYLTAKRQLTKLCKYTKTSIAKLESKVQYKVLSFLHIIIIISRIPSSHSNALAVHDGPHHHIGLNVAVVATSMWEEEVLWHVLADCYYCFLVVPHLLFFVT
jgi:hypothetical protein